MSSYVLIWQSVDNTKAIFAHMSGFRVMWRKGAFWSCRDVLHHDTALMCVGYDL